MKAERAVKCFLEWLYPVLFLSMIVPVFYLFHPSRSDDHVLIMYLAGFLLLPVSAVSRTAAQKVVSFAGYALICVLSAGSCILAGRFIGERAAGGSLSLSYQTEIAAGCLVLIISSARIRMRDKYRRRAMEENDITWRDVPVTFSEPSVFGLIWFASGYILALFNHCPVFCNAMLIGGILYLFLFLLYRQMIVTEEYRQETKNLTNVPYRKIRRLRYAHFLALSVLLGVIAVFSVSMSSKRIYHDMRFWEFKQVIPPEDFQFPEENPMFQGMPPELEAELLPHREPSKWLIILNILLPAAGAGLFFWLIWKGIRLYIREFRGAPEENGDEVFPLGKEKEETIFGSIHLPWDPDASERERIRRTYRRTIRKYRKAAGVPEAYLTPSQIEQSTAFPDNYDIEDLHNTYEEARYGE